VLFDLREKEHVLDETQTLSSLMSLAEDVIALHLWICTETLVKSILRRINRPCDVIISCRIVTLHDKTSDVPCLSFVKISLLQAVEAHRVARGRGSHIT
jgi:hypothetical protein